MIKAMLAVANGVEEIEALAVVDVLVRGDVNVTLASITPNQSLDVVGAHNITFKANKTIENVANEQFDVIIVPGGMPGTINCQQSSILINMLKEQQANNKLIASICAAPGFVLAHHGILTDKIQATGYPGCVADIPNFVDKDVVNDKDAKIITGKGPGVAIKFGLEILATLTSQEVADNVAKGMIVK